MTRTGIPGSQEGWCIGAINKAGELLVFDESHPASYKVYTPQELREIKGNEKVQMPRYEQPRAVPQVSRAVKEMITSTIAPQPANNALQKMVSTTAGKKGRIWWSFPTGPEIVSVEEDKDFYVLRRADGSSPRCRNDLLGMVNVEGKGLMATWLPAKEAASQVVLHPKEIALPVQPKLAPLSQAIAIPKKAEEVIPPPQTPDVAKRSEAESINNSELVNARCVFYERDTIQPEELIHHGDTVVQNGRLYQFREDGKQGVPVLYPLDPKEDPVVLTPHDAHTLKFVSIQAPASGGYFGMFQKTPEPHKEYLQCNEILEIDGRRAVVVEFSRRRLRNEVYENFLEVRYLENNPHNTVSDVALSTARIVRTGEKCEFGAAKNITLNEPPVPQEVAGYPKTVPIGEQDLENGDMVFIAGKPYYVHVSSSYHTFGREAVFYDGDPWDRTRTASPQIKWRHIFAQNLVDTKDFTKKRLVTDGKRIAKIQRAFRK